MTALDYFKKCFSKSFSFEGRASRSEYWYFILVYLIIIIIGLIIGFITLTQNDSIGMGIFIAVGIFFVAAIPAGISVKVRRLHDIGYGGWWFFIAFVPFIGGVWSLVLSVFNSEMRRNKYGEHPYGFYVLDKDGNTLEFSDIVFKHEIDEYKRNLNISKNIDNWA